jgi:hypothetical protein
MNPSEKNSILRESMLGLAEAARRLPAHREGKPVSASCLLRWVLTGVRGPSGKVHLEAVRLGGKWITSLEALERFAEALTPRPENARDLPRSVQARQRASERASKRLDQLGM